MARSDQWEPEVVEGEPLGSVLRQWVVQWMAEYPPAREDNHMGPIAWLHERTLRPAIGHEISIRQISRICNGEKKFVALTQADALLTAISKDEMLRTGEIPIIPNPLLSLETYMTYMESRGCI